MYFWLFHILVGEEALYVTERIISKGEDLTERKQLLYENGDCIISLPGGVGTFDEIWESVSHKSLGMKGLTNKPIVLLNTDGFYDGFILQLNRAFVRIHKFITAFNNNLILLCIFG